MHQHVTLYMHTHLRLIGSDCLQVDSIILKISYSNGTISSPMESMLFEFLDRMQKFEDKSGLPRAVYN